VSGGNRRRKKSEGGGSAGGVRGRVGAQQGWFRQYLTINTKRENNYAGPHAHKGAKEKNGTNRTKEKGKKEKSGGVVLWK